MAEQTPTQGNAQVQRAPKGSGSAAEKAVTRSRFVLKQSAVVDAAGEITIDLGTVPSGKEWEIERYSIHCTSPVQTEFAIYADIVTPVNRKDFTPIGNDNVADNSSPIWCSGGQNVIAHWDDVAAVDGLGVPCVGSINLQVVEVG